MAPILKFKRRRNKKKKVNNYCQLIETPKMRRGPHKMPSRAACGPRASCLRPLQYNSSHFFNFSPSASSRVDQMNSDSLAAQIPTALVNRVKGHDCLTFDIGYCIHVHVGLMGGSGDVSIDVTFPW